MVTTLSLPPTPCAQRAATLKLLLDLSHLLHWAPGMGFFWTLFTYCDWKPPLNQTMDGLGLKRHHSP